MITPAQRAKLLKLHSKVNSSSNFAFDQMAKVEKELGSKISNVENKIDDATDKLSKDLSTKHGIELEKAKKDYIAKIADLKEELVILKKSFEDTQKQQAKNFKDELKKLSDVVKYMDESKGSPAGVSQVAMLLNGSLASKLWSTFNLIAGSGVTMSAVDNNALARTDITITSSGGSGINVYTKTSGNIDGSNLVFGVANKPLFISVDGSNKFENIHYTYSANFVTITDGVAPAQDFHYFA